MADLTYREAEGYRRVLVQRGDTLSTISLRETGTTANVSRIATDSGIADPDQIRVGQQVLIASELLVRRPEHDEAAPTPSEEPAEEVFIDFAPTAVLDEARAETRTIAEPHPIVVGGQWARGQPGAAVINLSRETANRYLFKLLQNDILKLSTSKTLDNPVGSWSLTLALRQPDSRYGEDEAAPSGAPEQIPLRAMDLANPLWYNYFKPMDQVGLDLGYGPLSPSGDPLMLGYVDEVARSRDVSLSGLTGAVTVTGRDSGKLLTEDRIDFWPTEADSDLAMGEVTDATKRRIASYIRNYDADRDQDPLFDRLHQRIFGVNYGLNDAGQSVWFTNMYEAIQFIMNRFVSPLGTRTDGEALSSRWGLMIDPALRSRGIADASLGRRRGPIWEFIESIINRPFVEAFTDTIKGKGRFIVRRTPYDRALWEPLKTRLWWKAKTDEGQFHHLITSSEVISETFQRTDREVINAFYHNPQAVLVDAAIRPLLAGAWLIYPMIERYLMRSRQWTTTFYALGGSQLKGAYQDGQINQAGIDRDRLVRWFTPNVFLESAHLTIRARPEIRIGDRVLLEESDKLGYVVDVRNSYEFGLQPRAVTELGLVRVWPRKAYRYILDFEIVDGMNRLTVEQIERYYRTGEIP